MNTSSRADVPDPLLLLPLRQRIAERGWGVRAIHVHRAGRPEVSHRYVEDTAENVYSVSKTVTALAVGLAIEEGLLELEDLLVDHLGDDSGTALGRGVEQIRLRHLLTMTSGSPHLVFEDDQRLSSDVAGDFLRADLTSTPGERFEYSNGSIYVLGRAVAVRAGMGLRDWLMPRLFEPLGILNPQWDRDRSGRTWGATGLHLRSGELARIAQLLLQRGQWEGRPLVPAEWIDRMHAPDGWVETGDADPENARYGLGVWDCTPGGAWRADGAYGQFCLILPQQDAAVTITAHIEGTPTQDLLRAVWTDLLPLL